MARLSRPREPEVREGPPLSAQHPHRAPGSPHVGSGSPRGDDQRRATRRPREVAIVVAAHRVGRVP